MIGKGKGLIPEKNKFRELSAFYPNEMFPLREQVTTRCNYNE